MLGTIPVIFLYSRNLDELNPILLVRPLVLIVVCFGLICTVLRTVTKNYSKYTFFLFISLFLLFFYPTVKKYYYSLFISFDVYQYGGYLALASIALIWFVAIYMICTRNVPDMLHDFLNIMTVTTLLISITSIVYKVLETPESPASDLREFKNTVSLPQNAKNIKYPDIIYIVPDRYPNNYVLERYFNYDNKHFINQLNKRGFFVAETAHANYPTTSQSLASMLNMRHITNLSNRYGEDTGHRGPLYDMLQDHAVQRLLRAHGYRYVHLGSWWPPSEINIHADLNFRGRTQWLTHLELLLLQATPFADIWAKLRKWSGSPKHLAECNRVKKKIEYLKHAAGNSRPTFVFAHFLVPHPPIKFDADGNCIEGPSIEWGANWEEVSKGFTAQVEFVSAAILDIFDTQLNNNPNPIVFVVQADEGPFPVALRLQGDNYNWESADSNDLVMKFGILNALYFHNRDYHELNNFTTPVNNFRIIFNNIFRGNLPLLEDSAYVYINNKNFYKFTDVTEVVRSLKRD